MKIILATAALGEALAGIVLLIIRQLRASDHSFDTATANKKIYHAALTLGTQRRSRFIKQEYFRIKDENRCEGDALLFAARKPVWHSIFKMLDLQRREDGIHAIDNFGFWRPQLERTERHFVENAWIEKLHVWILENKSYAGFGTQNQVLVLRAKLSIVKKVAERLIATRGVKHGRFTLTTTGSDLPG